MMLLVCEPPSPRLQAPAECHIAVLMALLMLALHQMIFNSSSAGASGELLCRGLRVRGSVCGSHRGTLVQAPGSAQLADRSRLQISEQNPVSHHSHELLFCNNAEKEDRVKRKESGSHCNCGVFIMERCLF